MVKNFRRNWLAAAVSLALAAAGLLSPLGVLPAGALTNPPAYAPREFSTQQVHYLRFTVNPTSCVPSSLVCYVKVGSIPYNSFMTGIWAQTTTTWSGGSVSALTIGVGTTIAATQFLDPTTDLKTAAAGAAKTFVAANVGLAATGNGIAQSGSNGGFDVYALITATTGWPTAGSTTFVITYIAPNDGSCVPVPLGSTAVAC